MKLLLLAAGCAQTTGPHLAAATPASGPRSTLVTIDGARMCAGDCTMAGGELVFSIGASTDVQLPVIALADARAQVTIPNAAPIGKGTITLTVNDTASNALAFEVLP